MLNPRQQDEEMAMIQSSKRWKLKLIKCSLATHKLHLMQWYLISTMGCRWVEVDSVNRMINLERNNKCSIK